MTKELLKWLGYDGVAFFQMVLDEYGELNAVWSTHGFPHPVHFREGMAVRNIMRDIHGKNNKAYKHSHWYDDNWEKEIIKCIDLCNKGRGK